VGDHHQKRSIFGDEEAPPNTTADPDLFSVLRQRIRRRGKKESRLRVMGMGGFMGAATRTRSSARASRRRRSDQGASGSIGTGKRWKREGGCLTRHRHSTSSRGSALGEDWRRLSILTRNMRQASLSVVYPLAAQRRGTAAPAWSQLDWPRKVSSERWDSHHKGIKGR
jgi:hypothetical protein